MVATNSFSFKFGRNLNMTGQQFRMSASVLANTTAIMFAVRALSSACGKIVSQQHFHDSVLGRIAPFTSEPRQLSATGPSDNGPIAVRLTRKSAEVLNDKTAGLAVQGAGDPLEAGKISYSVTSGTHQILDRPLTRNRPLISLGCLGPGQLGSAAKLV